MARGRRVNVECLDIYPTKDWTFLKCCTKPTNDGFEGLECLGPHHLQRYRVSAKVAKGATEGGKMEARHLSNKKHTIYEGDKHNCAKPQKYS